MTEPAAVVLLHGIWMRSLVTRLLAWRLRRCGYRVYAFDYPSVRRSPADNAAALQRFVAGLREPVVHFVAHSLGGLVVLHLFEAFPRQRPGRVVLLGTPLRGSLSAARLRRWPGGGRLLGRSVERGLLSNPPRWRGARELAVIAGRRSLGLGRVFGAMPGPNDGAVLVAETRVERLTDHCVLPVSHTGLLFAAAVARAVCCFLRSGHLREGAAGP